MNRQIEEWYAQLVEIEPTIADPERRQQLQQAMAQIREGQAIVNAEYQKTANAMTARGVALEQRNAETLTQLEALQSEAAAASSALVPASPPLPSIDPARGRKLRDELIQRYVHAAHGIHATGRGAGDVTEMGSGDFKAAPAPRPATPLPPVHHVEPAIEETPEVVIEALLQLARVAARDVIYNLGCGDGRLLISAASKHGCRGVGIDSRAAVVEVAHNNLRKARLGQLLAIDAGNPLATNLFSATVLFLGLGAAQNSAMRDALLRQLRAGTRIVTHQGGLTDWPHDDEKIVRDSEGRTYRLRLWRIPGPTPHRDSSSIAKLSEGDWKSQGGHDSSSITDFSESDLDGGDA